MESLTVVLEDRVTQPDAERERPPGSLADAMLLKPRPALRVKPILLRIFPYFELTVIATHIWTVIIAFHYGGFLMGVGSLILPGPAEVYWMVKLFDEHPVYTATALLHLLLVVPMKIARKSIPY